jgi:hypothetical protein
VKRQTYALLACLTLGFAAPVLACPTPGAAKFKPDEVLQEAYILDRQGDFKPAIEQYQKVLKFFPDNRKGHYLLANCYWRDGQLLESRLEWETVLRMDPEDRWGREARTWLKDNADGADASGAMAQTLTGGTDGFADGPLKAAKFKWPTSMVLAGTGHLWVADTGNGRIRKISPDGRVTTVVGDGKGGYADGPFKSAKIGQPTALALDPVGNLYFADEHRIRFLTPTGLVGTLAGGSEGGTASGDWQAARFTTITAMAADEWGNVYVADGAIIRMVTPKGDTKTIAGGKEGFLDGLGDAAQFRMISAMKMTPEGALIVLDAGNNRIRKVTKAGEVTTLAGCDKKAYLDGPAAMAHFGMLAGVAVGEDGSLFLADAGNHAIRHRAANDTVVTVVGGAGEGTDDGRGIMASFLEPTDMALKGRTLYVLDKKASAIRKVML